MSESQPQVKETEDKPFNPHSVPFLAEMVDEDGQPILLNREDTLASALHMVIHVILETAPQYASLLDAIKTGLDKQPKDKPYTRDEVTQLIEMLGAVYVKLIDTQSKAITDITNKIPKKETGISKPPTYIG